VPQPIHDMASFAGRGLGGQLPHCPLEAPVGAACQRTTSRL
jgi:hypothetical protein